MNRTIDTYTHPNVSGEFFLFLLRQILRVRKLFRKDIPVKEGRSDEVSKKYLSFLAAKGNGGAACVLCIKEAERDNNAFTYWSIVKNDFPYDLIAERHDLLVSKRCFGEESGMSEQERDELVRIKNDILPGRDEYDIILENFPKGRSVPTHYHLHLIKCRRNFLSLL
jgi:hypothetical protein